MGFYKTQGSCPGTPDAEGAETQVGYWLTSVHELLVAQLEPELPEAFPVGGG